MPARTATELAALASAATPSGAAAADPTGLGSQRPGHVPGLAMASAWLVGVACAISVVGVAGPLQSRAERAVLGRWLVASTAPWRSLNLPLAPSSAVVTAMVVLLASWLVVAVVLWRAPTRPRRTLIAAAIAWCAPFVLGVPVFSRDVYAYVAQGALLNQGVDPYQHPVASLSGHPAVLAAVDPLWRHTLTPYGPLGLRIEQFAAAVGGGQEWRAVLVLRAVACLAVAITTWCVWSMAPVPYRALSVWLWLSPLVLIHLLSAAHLDAVLCALLAGSMLAAVRGHPLLAITLATAGGEVKATAFVVVPLLLVHTLNRYGGSTALRAAFTSLATVAVASAAYLTNPFGWLGALATPGSAWDPYTPSSTLALAVSESIPLIGGHAFGWLITGFRITAAALGVVFAGWVLLRARQHSLALSSALLLLDVALTGPALWPWYLTPVIPLLLMTGRLAAWFAAAMVSTAGSLLALPLHVVPAQRVAAVAEVGVSLFVLLAWVLRRRRGSSPLASQSAGWASGE